MLVFACWTALVVLFVTHAYLYSSTQGIPMDWQRVLPWAMAEWYTWAALTPFMVRMAQRYSLDTPAPFRALLINVAGAAFFSIVHLVIHGVLRYAGFAFFARASGERFHVNVTTAAVVISCAHAVQYYHRYREREMKTAQLQAALSNAQLDALRMQINPHFLFNTLNSISALIDEDSKAAQKMLSRLADFLRITLKTPANQLWTLEQELEFLRGYLQIEQVRFVDRLKITFEVEPAALTAKVPSLILQPIVENAFRHALPKVESARIDVCARRQDDRLELSVKDNGPGLSGKTAANEGIGLQNTRARLQTQYGRTHNLSLENSQGGGLMVTIRIPFQT